MKLRRWTLLGLIFPFLVGCASNVNLIEYHRSMDRWDDTPALVEAKYKESVGLYTEIMRATTSPGLAPYPTLDSNLKSMKRYADKVEKELRNVQKAKKHFQAYAYSRRTVTSKDKAAWAEFEKQRAEYTAYQSAMNSHVSGFNRAFNAFHRSIKVYGIKKTSNQQMRAQVDGMMQNFYNESKRMEDSLANKISGLAFGTIRGGPAFTRQRRAILTKMDEVLASLPPLRTIMDLLAESASTELAGDKEFWTGPGMSERPHVVDEVARNHREFSKIRTRFTRLEARFDKIGKHHPNGVAHPKVNSPGTARAGSSSPR